MILSRAVRQEQMPMHRITGIIHNSWDVSSLIQVSLRSNPSLECFPHEKRESAFPSRGKHIKVKDHHHQMREWMRGGPTRNSNEWRGGDATFISVCLCCYIAGGVIETNLTDRDRAPKRIEGNICPSRHPPHRFRCSSSLPKWWEERKE